jgi:hypothetical protein
MVFLTYGELRALPQCVQRPTRAHYQPFDGKGERDEDDEDGKRKQVDRPDYTEELAGPA